MRLRTKRMTLRSRLSAHMGEQQAELARVREELTAYAAASMNAEDQVWALERRFAIVVASA